MLNPLDIPIVNAFLIREADMYRWEVSDEGVAKKAKFIRRCLGTIRKLMQEHEADYVHIQSISNMGLKDSELVLTQTKNWVSGKNLMMSLPPNPRNGGIGWCIKDRKGNILDSKHKENK